MSSTGYSFVEGHSRAERALNESIISSVPEGASTKVRPLVLSGTALVGRGHEHKAPSLKATESYAVVSS